MSREREGFISKRKDKDGKVRLFVRIQYTDASGKRREKMRRATSMTEARKLRKDLARQLDDHGLSALDGDQVTFAMLASEYKAKRLFPAKIVNGRKVAGLKSVRPAVAALNPLSEHFGNCRIKSITHAAIESYKVRRLETPTIYKGQRQIASVNRELEMLRAVLRFAIREALLMRSPFDMGAPLISKADETRRDRIITYDEEFRLLEVLSQPERAHLRPLFIAALDTAARRGELLKLRWRDVDLTAHTITIIAENSKTARPRTVGITPRLHEELTNLWNASQDIDQLVFGVTCTFKTGWKTACTKAGILGLKWHDLRHSAITRMVQTGEPAEMIKKVSGHTQSTTFSRYINPGVEVVTRIAEALAEFNSKAEAIRTLETVN